MQGLPPILRSNYHTKWTRPVDLTQILFHLIESNVPLAGFKLEGPPELFAHPPQHLDALPLTETSPVSHPSPPSSPPFSPHSPRHLTDTVQPPEQQTKQQPKRKKEKEEAEICKTRAET